MLFDEREKLLDHRRIETNGSYKNFNLDSNW